MLPKILAILLIVAFLCVTVSLFPQDVSAYDCSNLYNSCMIATEAAITVCAIAVVDPTPYTEAACAAMVWNMSVVCSLYNIICNGGGG